MRKLLVLAVAGWIVVPGWAAKRVTVAQLAESVSTAIAQHRSDDEIARKVSALELSQRLSPAMLERFAARFPLQPRTALALQLVADQSAFFDPPPDELPAAEPPDPATQQKMLDDARAYAVRTWSRLPNFFVSRTTTRFDDGAQVLHTGEFPVRIGLHPVGTATRQITFRDGKEVQDPTVVAASGAGKASEELGLRSWGEFGPALTVVLADTAHHGVTFSHWEQTAGGLAAVYRYEVPREASHYMVTYSYVDLKAVGRMQSGDSGQRRSSRQTVNLAHSREVQTFQETPGYHGALAIDPATGAVLRITIDTTLSPKNPLLRASTMIEYGPVTIGDRKFIFPVRSLAISAEPGSLAGCGAGTSMALNGVRDLSPWQTITQHCDNTPVLLINETKFADYHRLGSTARILTDAAGAGPAGAPQTGTPPPSETAPVTHPVNSAVAPTQAPELLPESSQPSASTGPVAEAIPPALPAAPASPPEPFVPEISLSDAGKLPETAPFASGLTLKLTSRLVDVGVVAFDKKGRPVTDLKADDFEVYDNNRKQDIRFFTPAPGTVPPPAAPEVASHSFSNRAPEQGSAATPVSASSASATILLIDESHIAWSDLSYARGQMLAFVEKTQPAERVGLYSMTTLGFRVLLEPTTDHASLAARLKAFTPNVLALARAQEEESRNRQQIEEVHHVEDLNFVNGNRNDVPDSAASLDPQFSSRGANPARDSLIILAQVARHLAALPGHKNLVWVSSDNVFADWQDQAVGIDKSPRDAHSFAIRVQESMNDAHTAVYPFDVSQLESGGIGADIQHRNVELDPAARENAATAASASGSGADAGGRNMQPGRITAQMSQDLHPIQGTIRDVATATGGRTIRRTSELAAALTGIVEDGRAIYQVSFSPQGPADDQYHAINVKLTGRRGITLRHRTGYMFAKEPQSLKDRFQAAIWRPVESSEIGVTADVVPAGAVAQLKVNIAAADLGMQEQAGRWMDKLDIFFIQRDDAGLHAQVEGQTLGLRLKSSTYQNVLAQGVPFERTVELRAGMASVRVLVVDENSGRMGSVTIPSAALRAKP